MRMFDAIGLGWDVGGWQGQSQAIAAVGWRRGEPLQWLGISTAFRLSSRSTPTLAHLLMPALRSEERLSWVLSAPAVTLGVDAPLAFPRALCALLQGQETAPPLIPEREIDNPYAYRECERWLHQHYGKKPLSASFDRLGNNATLAMTLLRSWNIPILPVQPQQEGMVAIETYPALAKPNGRRGQATSALHALLPKDVIAGSDPYDAALCALMALQHAAGGRCDALPSLVFAPPEMLKEEGWIYHFAS
ncbi:DUF429 domain-containing protein [Aeromonas simiae]|uniref:DUF429 domain-containing protein n=1 Tax=Aeromonas simiae TaxID=218936 RepID=UPI0005A884AF|nr:DUF429 domain-containing protein [Aeromonas simiae]MDO2949818.1 DUF429 domain-containing protein [Aeromonas simiae]MDO2951422.1 DUF429 domain-containing protein [Aeromonas simiae]MDO2957149.1 DUF429 domain-containing protein [Aeromonas simiae]